MRKTNLIFYLVLLLMFSRVSGAGELVRGVRSKLSAGDLASGLAAVEDYKKKNGVDAEYLDAVGWLARGAEMLRQYELAANLIAELRREIPTEKPDLISPLGAAIEVEGKLRAVRDSREGAVRFLEQEFTRAKDVLLRSRIRRGINSLSLEGQPAPEISIANSVGPGAATLASFKGRPVLLFLWAHWCGDCRAQAASLSRVWQKYQSRGLVVLAPTRTYGTGDEDKPATPEAEKIHIEKIWSTYYSGLSGVPVTIDTETMVRYGVAATPTFVLLDRRGIVRLYAPTRLSETELSRRIEAVLAEKP